MPPVATPDRPRTDRGWWIRAFGPWYLAAYAGRDDADARRNLPGLVRLLVPPVGARILDLACGEGRYARALAALGYRVTGVDLSEDLLAEARRRSPALPGAPTYVRGDMRALPFQQQFEAAISIFTSFGYFEDRKEDAKVLDGVRRALVPGGRFLLDFLNASEVRENLVPESEATVAHWRISSARRVDDASPGGPYVRKRILVTDARTGRPEADVEERVRLYEPAELDAMLAAAGLAPIGEALGDFDGRPFESGSPRWIRVARRAASGRG